MPRPAGRREEILNTFVRHVAERGYERANIGDIAVELGMSKGTVVHHFGTKAKMLAELEENYMRRQLDAVRMIWDRLATPPERVAAIIFASALLQVVARHETVASQREVVQLADDPALQTVRKLRRELQQLAMDEVKAGIDAGVFRTVDPEVAALQLFGSVQWMWVWFDPNAPRSAEVIGGAFVDVFLGGLLVDRLSLAALADPKGTVATIVGESLTAVAATAQ